MKSKEKNRRSFPVISLTFSLIAWAFVGVIVGVFYLMAIEPEPISTGEPIRENFEVSPVFRTQMEVRYYRSQSFGHRVEALAKQLFSSSNDRIEVTSRDLNGWAERYLAPAHSSPVSASDKTFLTLQPGVPQLQIVGGILYVYYPFDLRVYGEKIEMAILFSGTFHAEDYQVEWDLGSLYINSAAIPFKQSLYRWLRPHVIRSLASREDIEKIVSAWNIIDSIELNGNTMTIHRKTGTR